ncbi:MAG: Uncharacterised protein [SAR116 cluster bacterium]|nr:MAG: Uncharacterised protein [SAR116 cluster bacterium]
MGCCLAIQFVAGRMALFDPHHAKRLGTIGNGIECCANSHKRVHHGRAIARRHGDLVGKFARE